jgi:RNA polymerase sigma factor (sigma-70 family)
MPTDPSSLNTTQRTTTEGGLATSDAELVLRIRMDDADAFRELFERHGRAIYLACSIVGTTRDAEDASQDAWLLFWSNRRTIQLASDSPLPWLLVTVRHKALHRRDDRHARHVPLGAVDFAVARRDEDPAEVAHDRAVQRFVAGLVTSLSDIDRQIYERCIRDGESYSTVAAALGIGSGAIKHRISRIRIRLRKAITTQGGL